MDIERLRALLAAVPEGVTEPEGLTWTRLTADGGALHTGGSGGIVYASCAVASIDCPPERDPAMELIAAAPAGLAFVLGAFDASIQLLTCGCWEAGDGVCDRCDEAHGRLEPLMAASQAQITR